MKAVIAHDEWWTPFVREFEETDGPSLVIPTEIPDELWAEYSDALERFLAIKGRIVAQFGSSKPNPNYKAEWEQYVKANTPPPPPEDYDEYMARKKREGA